LVFRSGSSRPSWATAVGSSQPRCLR